MNRFKLSFLKACVPMQSLPVVLNGAGIVIVLVCLEHVRTRTVRFVLAFGSLRATVVAQKVVSQ